MPSPHRPTELQYGPYRILESENPKVPFQSRPNSFRFGSLTTIGLWLTQVLLQMYIAYCVQHSTPHFMWQVWGALFAEFLLSLQEMIWALNLIFTLFAAKEIRGRARYRLIGETAPSIDVCITCCGEAVDIIMNTVMATVYQQYPAHCFRVIILDDGRNDDLRKAVATLNGKFTSKCLPQVLYRSREVPVGEKSYFKAGNHQFGIEQCELLGKSEFFASLDADMIPESDWLRTMIPHLILDSELALANPPQVSCDP
jgi:cellulose synthase/poly-beta-1,6-N-acetylglucosamine synthase-like glycosyltransferase